MQYEVELVNSTVRYCLGGPKALQPIRANKNLTSFEHQGTWYLLCQITWGSQTEVFWLAEGTEEHDALGMLDALVQYAQPYQGWPRPTVIDIDILDVSPDATATWLE